jgi:hypothetical protein
VSLHFIGHKPGSLISAWTPARIAFEIDVTTRMIRSALTLPFKERPEYLDVALSRMIGLRVCAGQIKVKLKQPHSA